MIGRRAGFVPAAAPERPSVVCSGKLPLLTRKIVHVSTASAVPCLPAVPPNPAAPGPFTHPTEDPEVPSPALQNAAQTMQSHPHSTHGKAEMPTVVNTTQLG